jgi:hypothetical protein
VKVDPVGQSPSVLPPAGPRPRSPPLSRYLSPLSESDDFDVVDEPSITAAPTSSPTTSPTVRRACCGDDEGVAFVAAADELEEQVGRLELERDVADIGDHQ